MAIDIGAGAIDRATSVLDSRTRIELANSANATGTIDTWEFWFETNGVGVKIGTFYGSGTDYTNRDFETIGNVTAGSKQTFTGLSTDVTVGDYAGYYCTDGLLEYDTGVGSGHYRYNGDAFGAGLLTYTLVSPTILSFYGTGTEAGGQTFYQNTGQGSMAIASTSAKVGTFYRTIGQASMAVSSALVKLTSRTAGGASISIASILAKKTLVSMGQASVSISSTLTKVGTFIRTVGGAAMTIASSLSAGLFIAQAVGGAALTIAGALSTIFHDTVEAVKTRWHFPTRSYDGTRADEIQGYGTAPDEITGYGTPKPRYKFPSDYE